MTTPRRALVVLGSSIAPEKNLPAAVARLAACPGIEVIAVSGVYESPPLDRPGDPWFHNAALALETTLSPADLRREFRAVEAVLGRVRSGDPYAPRPIDVDLVAFEGVEGEVAGARARVEGGRTVRKERALRRVEAVDEDAVGPEVGREGEALGGGWLWAWLWPWVSLHLRETIS